MASRTNPFQRVITYIAGQLSHGATVQESALVPEKGTNRTREVDTLVEGQVGVARVRIAIEARNRARKGTVEWVDALIGKYRDLDIDLVVAVSSKGFTAAAHEKASRHRIRLVSPQEALEAD